MAYIFLVIGKDSLRRGNIVALPRGVERFDHGGFFCACIFIVDKGCGLGTLASTFASSYRIAVSIGYFVFAKVFKRGYFYDSQ